MAIQKPMLAADVASRDAELQYPRLGTPKIDGIRATCQGFFCSRSGKRIRNKHIQSLYDDQLEGFDGEFIVGDPTDHNCYNKTQSGTSTIEGEPDVTYMVFDLMDDGCDYTERLYKLQLRYEAISDDLKAWVKIVPATVLNNLEDLRAYEDKLVDQGYEGIMTRTPGSPYKHGKSTFKQGWLVKHKRFVDTESVLTGIVEQMQNTNEATVDELGKTKRSTAKDGLVGKATTGKFIIQDEEFGEVVLGPGKATDEQLQDIWDNFDEKHKGKIVKWKYFPHGMKDKPRHPIFLGFRDKEDM